MRACAAHKNIENYTQQKSRRYSVEGDDYDKNTMGKRKKYALSVHSVLGPGLITIMGVISVIVRRRDSMQLTFSLICACREVVSR